MSKKFLSAVDATGKSLPHTNEASRKARGCNEAMQHHFGMSSVFVTAMFDNENSLLMQVLSGVEVDDGTLVDSLTDSELSSHTKGRRDTGLNFPGLAAMNFEVLFPILAEEVIIKTAGTTSQRSFTTETTRCIVVINITANGAVHREFWI